MREFSAEAMRKATKEEKENNKISAARRIEMRIKGRARLGGYSVTFSSLLDGEEIDYIQTHRDYYTNLGFDVSSGSDYGDYEIVISWDD